MLGGATPITVTTSAAAGQLFRDNVRLAQDTTLNAGATGAVSFDGTSMGTGAGTESLAVNTGGTTTFSGNVGTAAIPLESLTTADAAGTAGGGTTVLGGAAPITVTTSAAAGQLFRDNVRLAQDATLNAGATGAVSFDGTIVGTGAGTESLAVNTGGTTTFSGNVGTAAIPLESLTTADAAGTAGGGTTVLGGAAPITVTTSAAAGQRYRDNVRLAQDTTLNAGAAGAVAFDGTVNGTGAGTESLAVNADGTTTFGGNVGTGVALESLTTADAAGTAGGGTTVLGGTAPITVTTSAAAGQRYRDNVQLAQDTTVSAGATGAVTFDGTVNGTTAGTESLAVNAGGTTTFSGNVGTTASRSRASRRPMPRARPAAGTTVLGSTAPITVTTSAAAGQRYRDNVRLAQDTTLNAGATGAVTFDGTVNGTTAGTESLAVDAGGTTTFGGNVGTGVALESLTTRCRGQAAAVPPSLEARRPSP